MPQSSHLRDMTPAMRHARHKAQDAPTDDPFWDLVAIARRLQGPGGCPWDRAQTVRSLLPHLVEEVWEVFCAARKRSRAELQEELGDVLYTVVFLTLLAERQGWFDLKTLLRKTRRKMIRRHPHVFGTKRAATAREAYAHWQAVKRRERPRGRSSLKELRGVLLAFWESLRLQQHAPRTFQNTLNRLARSSRTRD